MAWKRKAAFLAAMAAAGYEVKHWRGGSVSFRTEGQERFAQLRASTLGDGYGQEGILAIIEGRAPLPAGRMPSASRSRAEPSAGSSCKVNLIIDIQARLKDGKGPAYERWAKVYNLKMMAAALQYLQENNLLAYEDLTAKADAAVDSFHDLAGKIQKTEAAMAVNAELKAAIIDYAKTRPAFDGYNAAKYSNKYLAEHIKSLITVAVVDNDVFTIPCVGLLRCAYCSTSGSVDGCGVSNGKM